MAFFFAAKPPPLCLPHWGRGTASAVDRVLSQTAYLRRSLSALFHTARTLSGSLRSPPSPRGEGFVSGIAVFSYRSLPHWGRGTASAVDRVLSYIVDLRRSPSLSFIPLEPYPARSARHLPHAGKGDRAAVNRVLSQTAYLRRSLPALFHTAFPIQPPPLRGTSFHRKEGMTTRAPSLGRGCRTQRGGVGFLFAALGCFR